MLVQQKLGVVKGLKFVWDYVDNIRDWTDCVVV